MTDIDLTEAVNAAARAAYANACVEGADATHESACAEWDAGNVNPSDMRIIREVVLPIVWAAHRDIARQAWAQCADQLDETYPDVSCELHQDNPYEESRS